MKKQTTNKHHEKSGLDVLTAYMKTLSDGDGMIQSIIDVIGESGHAETVSEYLLCCLQGKEYSVLTLRCLSDVAKILIQNGADVNHFNGKRICPLFLAAKKNYVDVAKVLIENDADVNIECTIDGYPMTPLCVACAEGRVDIVKLLVQNGADINVTCGDYPTTSLYIASSKGYLDIVNILIHNGANVNAVNTATKETAVHGASWMGFSEIVKVLVQNGANVNTLDTTTKSALSCCALCYGNNNLPCVLQLLCLGAVINKNVLKFDRTSYLDLMSEMLRSIQMNERPKTNFLTMEEKLFLSQLGLIFARRIKTMLSFKTFYMVKEYVTYCGIFMAPGFGLGKKSIWKRKCYRDKLGLCTTDDENGDDCCVS